MVIRPLLLEVRENLLVVFANMLGIPAIASYHAFWEGCLCALEGHVTAAHDALSEIVEAVREVPCPSVWLVSAVGCHTGKRRHDGVKTVKLVCH